MDACVRVSRINLHAGDFVLRNKQAGCKFASYSIVLKSRHKQSLLVCHSQGDVGFAGFRDITTVIDDYRPCVELQYDMSQ
jgi:hypothetical protein